MKYFINFLELNISSFYGSSTDIVIKDELIYYRRYSMPFETELTPWSKIKKVEPGNLETLMTLVQHWNKEYSSDVDDGTSWQLKIQFGKRKMKFHGHQQFPGEWKELITLLGSMCGEDLSAIASM